jgi:hypothetical protein
LHQLVTGDERFGSGAPARARNDFEMTPLFPPREPAMRKVQRESYLGSMVADAIAALILGVGCVSTLVFVNLFELRSLLSSDYSPWPAWALLFGVFAMGLAVASCCTAMWSRSDKDKV